MSNPQLSRLGPNVNELQSRGVTPFIVTHLRALYDWEADHDDNEDGNMLSNDNNAPIVLTFFIDLDMVYTHNNTFWFEKSTICQRNISQLAPRVCAGGERSSDRAA